MTRDYNEHLIWVPHPVKNNMCYDTPQLNVTLAIQRAKKVRFISAGTNEENTYLGGSRMSLCDVEITRQMDSLRLSTRGPQLLHQSTCRRIRTGTGENKRRRKQTCRASQPQLFVSAQQHVDEATRCMVHDVHSLQGQGCGA